MASPFTQQTSTSSTSLLPPHNAFNGPRRVSNHSQTSHVSLQSSLAEKFSLAPSPAQWGMPNLNQPEEDDYLHNPDPVRDRKDDKGSSIFTARGVANLGCLAILVLGITTLFAGWPIITHFLTKKQTTQGGFNLGGINATGQIADIPGNWGLIDKDTPKDVYTKSSYLTPGDQWDLVFSDEFNTDGRTFYPGDDPYWEAVDLHYWGTNDLEWYDPSGATTKDGYLQFKLEKIDDPTTNHNLSYKSGMIQTWNKFCFTGGLIEASVRLPGSNNVHGLWPAVWTMGNLGRAGFGATLEGTWPYSYDSCDVGTLHNQTYPPPNQNLPELAVTKGDQFNGGVLSYMPGQRLSACTCPGESHPGPVRSDGTYVGRAAPEIDLFEATVTDNLGYVSQSSQWAPFNAEYQWFNTTGNYAIVDPTITQLNEYVGGVFQQTTSGLSKTNQGCYELEQGCFSTYGFEYKPGFDNGYISWINDGKLAWTVYSGGLAADTRVDIKARPMPQEPMYIIANLGFSINFGGIDFENVKLPAIMSVDWIRVYQPPDARNIGCDPADFPTANYINTYKEAYTNPNLTTWVDDYKQAWPKNKLESTC